jgi:septin family protein
MQKQELLSHVTKLVALEHTRGNALFTEELAHLRVRAENDVFTVAVVGEFSAGKSTFINAILRQDVLKHASKETTACITYLVNIPETEKTSCTITMNNGAREVLDNFDQLADCSTTDSKKFDVSNDIQSNRTASAVLGRTQQDNAG